MDHSTSATTANPNPSGKCEPKMNMSLHWGVCEWILVKTWKADTPGENFHLEIE